MKIKTIVGALAATAVAACVAIGASGVASASDFLGTGVASAPSHGPIGTGTNHDPGGWNRWRGPRLDGHLIFLDENTTLDVCGYNDADAFLVAYAPRRAEVLRLLGADYRTRFVALRSACSGAGSVVSFVPRVDGHLLLLDPDLRLDVCEADSYPLFVGRHLARRADIDRLLGVDPARRFVALRSSCGVSAGVGVIDTRVSLPRDVVLVNHHFLSLSRLGLVGVADADVCSYGDWVSFDRFGLGRFGVNRWNGLRLRFGHNPVGVFHTLRVDAACGGNDVVVANASNDVVNPAPAPAPAASAPAASDPAPAASSAGSSAGSSLTPRGAPETGI